ncbi:hypothetical protein ACET3X_008573 [Alternaria dauci]|uniref:Protein kinase domain-containing protein n=1 Tax=Alternaria dauci TaxID=48095 RepID=A0ABR3UAR2_9PLEO
MYDHYLTRSESDENLREKLIGVVHHKEVETIIGDFHKEKWKWCPLTLTLDMDENLHGTKVIPPFCLKTRLSEKGGTASIYWVAVQKDLISDNALALALQDSIYTDDEFGECYQMVLKSYCGNKRREFELEKEAFSGLQSNDQVPILKYLGAYTHDYGEGKGSGKTYNLLLEYGEYDLYQTWADETNVPPVQAQEILQNWKSIFNIAKAIHHVHHLEIRRGKDQPWRFHGWHADIKPDNILSVRGRLKLADFGFSSFAPVIEGHGGSEPRDIVRGFTDTYGAPEVSRMKQPDGTLTGVSQAIDAWSFGCVLSVAATWIVLGFQGVRQYERLRQLAPANNKDGVAFDRFHDGSDVLPEVEKWHEYLRGHLRLSDTTTGLVLDLIQLKLLRANPAVRHNMEDLCEKLEELSDIAKHKIQSLKKHSKDTDTVVMKALKKIEEEAQVERLSEPKTNLLQQPLLPVNPRERASMQIMKEELIRNKPLGQTAHRKQILEEKLDGYDDSEVENKPLPMAVYDGAVTRSPIEATPQKEVHPGHRKPKPRRPQFQPPGQGPSDRGQYTPNGLSQHEILGFPATPPSSDHNRKTFGTFTVPHSGDDFNSHVPSVGVDLLTSPNLERPVLRLTTPESPLARFPNRIAQSVDTPKLPHTSGYERPMIQHLNHPPPSVSAPEKTADTSKSHPRIPEQRAIDRGLGNQNSFTPDQVYHPIRGGDVPLATDTSSMGFTIHDRHTQEPIDRAITTSEPVGDTGPSITISSNEDTESPHRQSTVSQTSSHAHEKQLAEGDHTPHGHYPSGSNNPFLLTLPPTVLYLPYDICVRRKDLDEQVTKGLAKKFAKVKGTLGIETRARDSRLEETFSDPRELIFVVDNGWTMSKHWPIVTFVAQTLAKNAAGLDRNGFDLKFTVDGHTHNQERLKGDSGRKKLKKVLKAAWPEYKENNHVTTNMAQVFKNISDDWNRSGQPATTLFVLTDGVWSNTDLDALNKTILDIAEKDQSHAGNRHFSIQFVRFGDEEAQRTRLQTLDDGLCVAHNLRDIIDHCSWRAKVDKMFKGSIEGYLDEQDSDEEPILYDYKKLVDLFDTFNRAEEATLSPTNSLFRSPSRISHRSSTSLSNLEDWTGRR